MLKNNAFSGDKPHLISSGQAIMSGFGTAIAEIDKYINDFRLLDIRCGVLEEERQDYSNQLNTTKVKIKAVEKTLSQLIIEKEDCLTRLKKV